MSLPNIEQLARSYKVQLEPSGTNFKACCPLKGHEDSTPSMVVYMHTNSFYCFGCTRGGGPVSFIMYMEGISRDEALKKLGVDDTLSEIERMLEPTEAKQEDFNSGTNFIISSMVRTKLQQGTKWSTLCLFMQKLDRILVTEKLTEQQAKDLISEAQKL